MRVLTYEEIENCDQLEQYQKDVMFYRMKQYQQIESDNQGHLFYTVLYDGDEETIPLGFTAKHLRDVGRVEG